MVGADEKYPDSTGRRRFVKGVVGSASLAGLGTAAASAVNSATSSTGGGGGIVDFYGVENLSGPAPRAMPQIPVEIDSEGYLKGIWPEVKTKTLENGNEITFAEMELGGITYSSKWFQYCGVQTYEGVRPDADQENYFRYIGNSKFEWQNDSVEPGAKIHIDDFENYETWGNGIGRSGIGKPAQGKWRSKDVSGGDTIPIEVIRSTRIEEMAKDNEWLSASTEKGFLAHLNKCTHFCCVPSFKGLKGSKSAGAEDKIYCQCHQSVYDPFSIVKKSFLSLPVPDN